MSGNECFDSSASSSSSSPSSGKTLYLDPNSMSSENSECHRGSRYSAEIVTELPYGAIPIGQFQSHFGYQGGNYPEHRPRSRSVGANKLDIPVMIGYLVGTIGVNSGRSDGLIMIMVRRRNDTVTLEWETFKGQLAANSIKYLTLNAAIGNLPKFDVQTAVRIEYNGVASWGYLYINPISTTEKYQFHFDVDDSLNVKQHDSVTVYGGSATWITEPC